MNFISFPRASVGMRWATRQRCGNGTLARPDGIPTLARGNEENEFGGPQINTCPPYFNY